MKLSTRTHTIIGLMIGLALIVAPWLFGFAGENESAVVVAMTVGAFVLLSELTTTSEISLFKLVPMRIHVVMDVLTGFFLTISPWLFGFNNQDANVWLPHLLVGILVVGYAMATRTDDFTTDEVVEE